MKSPEPGFRRSLCERLSWTPRHHGGMLSPSASSECPRVAVAEESKRAKRAADAIAVAGETTNRRATTLTGGRYVSLPSFEAPPDQTWLTAADIAAELRIGRTRSFVIAKELGVLVGRRCRRVRRDVFDAWIRERAARERVGDRLASIVGGRR